MEYEDFEKMPVAKGYKHPMEDRYYGSESSENEKIIEPILRKEERRILPDEYFKLNKKGEK
jgi:hypothetical protein